MTTLDSFDKRLGEIVAAISHLNQTAFKDLDEAETVQLIKLLNWAKRNLDEAPRPARPVK